MLVVGRLEEAELTAVLVSPLTRTVIDVNSRIGQVIGVVLLIVHIFSEANNSAHKSVLGAVVACQSLTHSNSSTILNL